MRHTQTAGGLRRRMGIMAAMARMFAALGGLGGAGTDATSAIEARKMNLVSVSYPGQGAPIPRRVPNQQQRRKAIRRNPRLAARYRKGGRK